MAAPDSSPSIDFSNGTSELSVSIVPGEDGRGGIRETMWGDRGMEVAIDFRVPWKKRLQFLYLLRGSCGYDGANYWRYPPIQLPIIESDSIADLNTKEEFSSYPWNRYYCSSVGECRPIGMRTSNKDGDPTGEPGWPYYDEVIVPTKWSVPLYRIGDDQIDPATPGSDPSGFPYTTTRWRVAGQIFSPYTNAYRFAGEATPANEANIGILRAKTELSITRHFMPIVDTVALDALIGKVNLDEIQIGSDVNPPQSMIYLGYEAEPYVNPSNGRLVYDVTHRLLVNGVVFDKDGDPQESWNYFMNRQGYWDKLVLKDNPGIGVYRMDQFRCKLWPEYVSCER
jgi:hypothetical protein